MASVYTKLAQARKCLSDKELTKSGENENFKKGYIELSDFIDDVNEVNEECGILSIFNMKENVATLTVIDCEGDKEVVFETPLDAEGAEAKMRVLLNKNGNEMQDPIQRLGAIHTYLKRYLYMNAYEIAVADQIDSGDRSEAKNEAETPEERKKREEEMLRREVEINRYKQLKRDTFSVIEKYAQLTNQEAETVVARSGVAQMDVEALKRYKTDLTEKVEALEIVDSKSVELEDFEDIEEF